MTVYTSEDLTVAVKAAYDALAKATEIADALNESFSFSPAYGMGGRYQPIGGLTYEQAVAEFNAEGTDKWTKAALESMLNDYNADPETYKNHLFNLEYERLVDPENEDLDDYDSPFGWKSSSSSC